MKEEDHDIEGEQVGGGLYFAFIYLSVFFLVLTLIVQFEPLIRFRYPLFPLVFVIALLFVFVSVKNDHVITVNRSVTRIGPLLPAVITALLLLFVIIPEEVLAFLLVPAAFLIVFLEGYLLNESPQDEST